MASWSDPTLLWENVLVTIEWFLGCAKSAVSISLWSVADIVHSICVVRSQLVHCCFHSPPAWIFYRNLSSLFLFAHNSGIKRKHNRHHEHSNNVKQTCLYNAHHPKEPFLIMDADHLTITFVNWMQYPPACIVCKRGTLWETLKINKLEP